MYYGPKIIIATGINIHGFRDKEQMGIVLNLPLAFVNFLGNIFATWFIDHRGRRYSMLRTLPGIFISLSVVSICMYLSNFNEGYWHVFGNYLGIASLLFYTGFFSIGFSSTVWSVNTEIYPLHLISTATALSTTTNWFSNFIVSSMFLSILSTNIGKIVAFAILAVLAFTAYLFVYFYVPETNNKPILENVQNIIERRRSDLSGGH